MKEYTKEEKIKLIEKINKIQRYIFNYKKDNGKEPTNEEILEEINISQKEFDNINQILEELEEHDKEMKQYSSKHTKEDIIKAREIRKNKKEIKNIQKYMKGD